MDLSITALIGLFLTLATFVWTVYKYFDKKKREQDLKEFENYHKLIKELVQPEDMDKGVMYVDRQTAIVYELRHFKRYFAFSYRTLIGLKEKWGKVPNQYPRLIDECDRTISYLQTKIKKNTI
jgi:hypothetical protein